MSKSGLLLFGSLVLALGFVVPAGGQGTSDPSEPSLEERLAQLRRELARKTPGNDPWAAGRAPDLLIASVNNVAGEVAPCG